MKLLDNVITIYTDGSALYTYSGDVKSTKIKSADFGGIGVFFGDDDIRNISEPFYLLPITNNRTEIYAAIKAIQIAILYDQLLQKVKKIKKNKRKIIIYSDSEYLINLITKWVHAWKRKKWKKANGKPVENQDLIFWLDHLITYHKNNYDILFKHVKAHRIGSKIPRDRKSEEYAHWYGNNMADKLAKKATTISKKYHNKIMSE